MATNARTRQATASRQTGAAKTTPAAPAKVTPIKPAATPAAPAPAKPAEATEATSTFDLTALVATAKTVEVMPKRTRGNGGGASNMFADLVKASQAEGKPKVVGPVTTTDAKAMTQTETVLRNAGKLAGLKVEVTKQDDGNGGTLFYFQGKVKDDPKATKPAATPAAK